MEKSPANDTTATAPRIVNGLTVRPREKGEPWPLWSCGICLLPDFLAFLVLVCLCIKQWPRPPDKGNANNLVWPRNRNHRHHYGESCIVSRSMELTVHSICLRLFQRARRANHFD